MAWEISAKRNSDGACALLYSLDFIVVNNFKTDAEIALFEICQPRFTKHTPKFSLYFKKRFAIYSKADTTAFVFIVE
jgi:hypothetical protein